MKLIVTGLQGDFVAEQARANSLSARWTYPFSPPRGFSLVACVRPVYSRRMPELARLVPLTAFAPDRTPSWQTELYRVFRRPFCLSHAARS